MWFVLNSQIFLRAHVAERSVPVQDVVARAETERTDEHSIKTWETDVDWELKQCCAILLVFNGFGVPLQRQIIFLLLKLLISFVFHIFAFLELKDSIRFQYHIHLIEQNSHSNHNS